MISQIEDFAGRAAILVIFTFLMVWETGTIGGIFHAETLDGWSLILTSRIAAFIFLGCSLLFTLVRLPAKSSAAGLAPRVVSIAGTFVMSLLVVLPIGDVPTEVRLFGTTMIVVGTLLSIYCLIWLGRSFSMMATARKLVTAGPYSIVRHPLYAAEAITMIGVIIANWSVSSVTVGACWFALQYRRALNEEHVLRAAFPEYQKYAERVPMLVPHSRTLSTR
ncbi:isoprenylcysteine carboxylmethyltransferase family protein [Mesorhizobium loti]|nr:isoprenylcysteine carboxylmethyltransferase family protein [Mesorhizobium loti]